MSSVVDEIVVVPAHGKPALEDQFDLFDSDKEEINVEETHDKENNDEKLVEVHKLRAYEGSPPPQTKSINFEDVDDTNEGLIEMRAARVGILATLMKTKFSSYVIVAASQDTKWLSARR